MTNLKVVLIAIAAVGLVNMGKAQAQDSASNSILYLTTGTAVKYAAKVDELKRALDKGDCESPELTAICEGFKKKTLAELEKKIGTATGAVRAELVEVKKALEEVRVAEFEARRAEAKAAEAKALAAEAEAKKEAEEAKAEAAKLAEAKAVAEKESAKIKADKDTAIALGQQTLAGNALGAFPPAAAGGRPPTAEELAKGLKALDVGVTLKQEVWENGGSRFELTYNPKLSPLAKGAIIGLAALFGGIGGYGLGTVSGGDTPAARNNAKLGGTLLGAAALGLTAGGITLNW